MNPARRERNARIAALGFALAVVASIAVLLLPTETQVTECVPASGVSLAPLQPCRSGVSHRSLLEAEGPRVIAVLVVPVGIAGGGVLSQLTRLRRPGAIAAGILLSGFVVVGALSIGVFYLPSAIAMLVAGRAKQNVSERT